ncbi:hypothetical protein DITRI_Ditri19aG0202500 [Diplodiscus trichospermus]
MEAVLEAVTPCVSNEMNHALQTEFKAEEVCLAIEQMYPTKAPGPDAIVLVNHMKQILPSCISESLSAFVLGRLISDNILVAYELLHSLRNRRKGKNDYFALKLDMSKAYDKRDFQPCCQNRNTLVRFIEHKLVTIDLE